MYRFYWTLTGFIGGVMAIAGVALFYFWFFSPLRMAESVLGWKLPSGVALISQRNERDTFFGQGSTLSIFAIPPEFANRLLANCPSGFKSGTFAQSGIRGDELTVYGSKVTCFLRKEEPNRTDIIVFSQDKLFHLEVDH